MQARRSPRDENKGKPWRYLLIPHDAIADNMTIAGLVKSYAFAGPKEGE